MANVYSTDLGGFWKSVDKKGKEYLKGRLNEKGIELAHSGALDGKYFLIYKNTTKMSEKSPDYKMFVFLDQDENAAQQDENYGNRQEDQEDEF